MDEIGARDFGRLEQKVDMMLEQLREAAAAMVSLREENAELRSRVDKWEQRAIGALAVAGMIGGFLTWAANTALKAWGSITT